MTDSDLSFLSQNNLFTYSILNVESFQYLGAGVRSDHCVSVVFAIEMFFEIIMSTVKIRVVVPVCGLR